MIRSLLIGAVAGARALTPLAAVANAARRGELPRDNGAPAWLGHPLVANAALALAAGEMAGDKMRTAPDRIVAAGMAARILSGGIAGAALSPRRRRVGAAALGATAAVVASYLTFDARMRALRRYGQTPSGAVEDAIVLGSAAAVVRSAAPRR